MKSKNKKYFQKTSKHYKDKRKKYKTKYNGFFRKNLGENILGIVSEIKDVKGKIN